MADQSLRLKRGPEGSIPTLDDGEPGFTTDSFRMYVGLGGVNRLISGGGGGMPYQVINSNTPAAKDNGYLIDAGSTPVSLTLPSSPVIGDAVGFATLNVTNTVTIARNGSLIFGRTDDMVIETQYAGGILVYTGTTYGWVNVTEAAAGGGGAETEEVLTISKALVASNDDLIVVGSEEVTRD